MPKTTYQPVNVTDENGVTHTFQAGDEVPDELVARIDNPGIWEQPEGEIVDERPLGTVGTVENVTRPPADAPYATSEPFAPFQPDSGPVVETGSTELTGEQPPAGPSESDQTAGASWEAHVYPDDRRLSQLVTFACVPAGLTIQATLTAANVDSLLPAGTTRFRGHWDWYRNAPDGTRRGYVKGDFIVNAGLELR
jgi:hypothetical protein